MCFALWADNRYCSGAVVLKHFHRLTIETLQGVTTIPMINFVIVKFTSR